MGYGGDDDSPPSFYVFVENAEFPYILFFFNVALFGISGNKSLGINMFKNPFLFLFDTFAVAVREITWAGLLVTLKDSY